MNDATLEDTSVSISETDGILVKSPRTEAAQLLQCMFGTLRETNVVAASASFVVVSGVVAVVVEFDTISSPDGLGLVSDVHPINATSAMGSSKLSRCFMVSPVKINDVDSYILSPKASLGIVRFGSFWQPGSDICV